MMHFNSSAAGRCSSRGFSLIELMVAMTIGLILTIGVVQIFSASRSTYQLDEGLARAQENGRFAIEFMSREIRHAAHLGCRRWVFDPSKPNRYSIFNNLNGEPSDYQVSGIFAHEYNTVPTGPGNAYSIPANPGNTTAGWAPGLPANVTSPAGALPGSDIIGVERLTPIPINLAMPTTPTTVLMVPPAQADRISIDDIVMITDCKLGMIFQVTAVDTGTGAVTHDLGSGTPGNRCGVWANNVGSGGGNAASDVCTEKQYDPANTVLGQMASVFFFVARGAPPDIRPTLYQKVNLPGRPGQPMPLVEGVENIQILYGVDDTIPPDGTPERYVTANNIPNLSNVVSVRLGVLVNSVTTTGTATDQSLDTDVYNVAGTIINPQDDLLRRRVFTTTIQLRNRGI